MARKPKLPIGDDLARLLKLALAGAKGKPKQVQANRIVGKLESKGNPAVSGLRTKAGKMEQQLARGKVKRRNMESISADADKHMQRMAKQGKNWDGSPVKKATKPRKAAPKRKLTVAEQTAAAEREIANRANNARIIKKGTKAADAGTLGEAVGRKGTKMTRGGKEIPIPKKKADAIVRQGRRAVAQKKGGNAKLKAEQMNLQARFRNSSGSAKRTAKQALDKHRTKHGNFLG